jgi:iron(III) transport system substrate-binding protein
MMHSRLLTRSAGALVLAGALALAGCATAQPAPPPPPAPTQGQDTTAPTQPPDDDGLAELIAAAQAEGELVWYQVAAETTGDALVDAFMAAYPGITAEYIRLSSAQIEQRFNSETETGAPGADLIVPLDTAFFRSTLANGSVIGLPEADIPGFPESMPAESILADGATATVNITAYGIAYNTDEVTAADAPKTWADLLDPKWQGKMLFTTPVISPTFTDLFYLIEQDPKYGLDYFEQLGAMDLTIIEGAVPMVETLASGEGLVGLVAGLPTVENLMSNGAPLAYNIPDISLGAPSVLGISANAAHPAAARLFVYWSMTPEGLAAWNNVPGSVNPLDVANYPTYLDGPDVNELAVTRAADIYAALGL